MRLVNGYHPEGEQALGAARHTLAVAYQATGNLGAATEVAALAATVRLRRSIRSQHPSVADRESADSMLLCGVLHHRQGQAKGAVHWLTRAVELATTLGATGADIVATGSAVLTDLRRKGR